MMSGQFFFFKHKTAYDMRISDWSSDVGSSDLPIRLVSPAVRAREKEDWVLRLVRVEFAGGTADLSGRWGQARMVDAKLNDIGLSMLNLFNPELGLSGRASGTISYSQAAKGQLPKGRVALTVRNLSRAGLALTSTP